MYHFLVRGKHMQRIFRIAVLFSLAAAPGPAQDPAAATAALIARAKSFELDTPYVPPPGDPLSHHAAGFAKIMCSAVFITGLDPDFAAENVGYFIGAVRGAGEARQAHRRPRGERRVASPCRTASCAWRLSRRPGMRDASSRRKQPRSHSKPTRKSALPDPDDAMADGRRPRRRPVRASTRTR